MKYICDCINSLFFDYNCVKCGCSNTYGVLFLDSFVGTNFDMETINRERAKLIESFRTGNISEKCKNCYMLKEDTDGEIDKEFPKELGRIFISHWYHCNSGCIYCTNRHITNLKISEKSKKSDYYDLYPTIKYLCSNGYIGKDTKITSVGGEPTVLNEYEKIMKELMKYSEEYVLILSNGIIFSKAIYNILKTRASEIIISLDSGSREMYRRIKRVDKFNDVLKNIKKYMKANPKNIYSVRLKYILIKGVNDNIDEVNSFLDTARKLGVKKVYLAVDFNHQHVNQPLPEHWFEIHEKFLSTKDLDPFVDEYCQNLFEKKYIF